MPFEPPAKLLVLRITLLVGQDSQVELAFTGDAQAEGQDEIVWRPTPSELAVPESLDSGRAPILTLPSDVLDGLKAALEKEPKRLPLWLRFAKPHCLLGVQPWERVLTEELARPVLRLPEVLERPPESRQVLEIAVCYDAGPHTPTEDGVKQLMRLAASLASSSPRAQTRVNLFASSVWFERIRDQAFNASVVIHNPASAPTFAEARKRGASSWSLWLLDSLNGRSLDVVTLVCRAESTDVGPALLLSSSPKPASQGLCSVDAQELGALMTRSGAWGALFSPPANEPSYAALAFAADALAHARPAVSLCYPTVTDDERLDFQKICAFMFSPRPAAAPKLRAGFLYCQPAMVPDYATLRVASPIAATQINADLIEHDSLGDRVRELLKRYAPFGEKLELRQAPQWASAVQRHIETLALDELRDKSVDDLLSSAESIHAQLRAGDETLQAIQKVVADYLKK